MYEIKFSQTLTHSWCSLFLSLVFKQGMYLGEIKERRKKGDPGNEVDGNARKERTQIFENFVSLVEFKEFKTFLSL